MVWLGVADLEVTLAVNFTGLWSSTRLTRGERIRVCLRVLLAGNCTRPFTMASALAQKVWLKIELRACRPFETENQFTLQNILP
jgi:hypothetical protein